MNTFSCIRKNHILIENLLNLTLLDTTWNCLKLSQAVQVVQDNGAGLKSQLMKNCSSDVKHIKCLQAGVRYQVYLSKVPSSNNTMSCQVTVPSKIKLLYQVYLSRVPSSNNHCAAFLILIFSLWPESVISVVLWGDILGIQHYHFPMNLWPTCRNIAIFTHYGMIYLLLLNVDILCNVWY